MDNVIDISPGSSGKSAVLHQALVNVIFAPPFEGMTISEVLGTLELLKLNIAYKK